MAVLDTIIIIIITIVGLFIFYKALKEPIDALFKAIKKGIDSLREKVQDRGEYYETISYG